MKLLLLYMRGVFECNENHGYEYLQYMDVTSLIDMAHMILGYIYLR